MIISRKRFEAEITKRVDQEVCNAREQMWHRECEREIERQICKLEDRLIAVEKASGIDHPSHHGVYPNRW